MATTIKQDKCKLFKNLLLLEQPISIIKEKFLCPSSPVHIA